MVQGDEKQDKQFGYNGEEYIPQTGMQYLRARHYAPEQGRFTTQDTYLGHLTDREPEGSDPGAEDRGFTIE